MPTDKSKSEVKREMLALQKLGERLAELNTEQLDTVPIEQPLRDAIIEFKRIHSRSAKRRQVQYLGRLMRTADAEQIELALDKFNKKNRKGTRVFHMCETWRERLLNEEASPLDFAAQYPKVNVEELQQLIKSARLDSQSKGKATRRLFRYIRSQFPD